MGMQHDGPAEMLAEQLISDDVLPGLAWRVTVTPDDDTADGLEMYENHGVNWRWVNVRVAPVIGALEHAEAATGGTVAWGYLRNRRGIILHHDLASYIEGTRMYLRDPEGKIRADQYEVIPPVVPALMQQSRERLPHVIMAHVREQVAMADVLSEWADGPPDHYEHTDAGLVDTRYVTRDYGRSQDLASFANVYFNAKLLHDGMDGEVNPEYTRAMAELLSDSFGLNPDDKERLMADIASGTS